MGMFGGGAAAGGWSQGIGGQSMGPRGGNRTDGWDDEYLGKVYDAEVAKKVWPYLVEYKKFALIAFVTMLVTAGCAFVVPLLVGFAVEAGVKGDSTKVGWLCAA